MERKVAVTGLGIISCIGNDVKTFWGNLLDGVCGIDRITEFPVDGLSVKIGGKVKNFDPEAYGIEKSFIRKQDPFTVYAMAAAIQAMQNSGLESGVNIDRFRLGCNVSSGIGGFETIFREVGKMFETPSGEWISPTFVPSMIANMAAAQIAIRFKASGPCMNISTACATSTHSIGEAYRTILHGYADAMITGGTDHCTIPIGLASFANCRALTREENPKHASLPFNADRGGFVLADGAAVLVLEEYGHARLRGARIYGEICGYGSTCDAYHATSPEPEASAQVKAIGLACEQAGYDPAEDCVYVNAHGTGTRLNDVIETLAFKKAFGAEADRLHISSTKSMHGHMMGATGAAEAIATILTVGSGEIPPTINLDRPDPECDLNYTPNTKQKAGITLGLSNSLAFGGHNACLAFRK
ncbi:MAG: beta-ketoacyl-ACP synthase II [Bacteroidales bacterium]|nr:beta-ketoacyl-ACP synthase II [Candidatus Cryptobacteroides fimicaballi]